MSNGVVVIGGGHGGSQVAASLRSEGYEGAIALISEESEIPYQRPPLSKTYLKEPERGLLELRSAAFYTDHAIDLRLSTRVAAIDRRTGRVELADGGNLSFDHLVLATGARPRVPRIPGTDLKGVYLLRDAPDARALNEAFLGAESVAVVGGGFIGLELAATARSLGRTVTIVEATDRLMGRAVAPEVSAHFLDLHRGWGSTVLLNAPAQEIVGDRGRAAAVKSGVRDTVDTDLVVLGIGVVPNVELAVAAGLSEDNGVLVGPDLLTDDPRIYSIGDCVAFDEVSIGRRVRLESVQNAVDQGKAVARSIVGRGSPYRAVPWFWSDQSNVKLQMVGLADLATRKVLRGRPDDASFSVFQFADDRLVEIETVNKPGDHMLGRRVLDANANLPSPAQAGDESFDLKSLIKRPAETVR